MLRYEQGDRECTSKAGGSISVGLLIALLKWLCPRTARAHAVWSVYLSGLYRKAVVPLPGTSAPATQGQDPAQSLLHQLQTYKLHIQVMIQFSLVSFIIKSWQCIMSNISLWLSWHPLKEANWPPQNCIPVILNDNSIGIEIFRYSQVATLSPVHIAPVEKNSNNKDSIAVLIESNGKQQNRKQLVCSPVTWKKKSSVVHFILFWIFFGF